MNRPGPILLAAITTLAFAAMVASLLLERGWLYYLYWYRWVPALGLCSLSMLIWATRRWRLLALVPIFLLPLLGLIWFNAVCMNGGGSCI